MSFSPVFFSASSKTTCVWNLFSFWLWSILTNVLLKGTKFDKWHHKNPTKVHDAEQNLNGPLIVWGVMFHPIWININSENIQRKIRAFLSIKQHRFVFQSAFVMTLIMILFVLLTWDTMPMTSPPPWVQSLRYHPKCSHFSQLNIISVFWAV